ncbi:MAG: S8 family serine peptidase [Candidatus Marinimicrobia bacterium]|nr:S8 family serine peptidase [Candidatus Neomarinimicrobiota bacterium]
MNKYSVFALLMVSFVFCTDGQWTAMGGQQISSTKIAIEIDNEIAPRLGEAAPLSKDYFPELVTLSRQIPEFNFRPLFTSTNSFNEKHYRHQLHLYYVLEFTEPVDILSIMDELSIINGIISVEPSYKVDANLVPNDPLYPLQWAHNNSGQAISYGGNDVGTLDCDTDTEEAWDITTGDSEVIIAILDTGVNNHEEFTGRMVPGYDFVNNDDDPADDFGHGSSCAGIAAAAGNNGVGIAGVAWESSIMSVKVLDSGGSGNDTDIADAITWASDNGADVISMSLGGGGYTGYLDNAINYAVDNGTVVFAASGNDNNGTVSYPSAYDNCISVGALSPCNERKNPGSCDGEDFWGSNYGDELDFLSPGVRIHTTTMSGGYTSTFNGTSSACPHAAGIAGLILAAAPDLTPLGVRNVMQATCDDLDIPGWDSETGYGRLNAFSAVSYSLSHPTIELDVELLTFDLETGATDESPVFILNTGDEELIYTIDTQRYYFVDSQSDYTDYDWVDISQDNTTLTIPHNDQAAPSFNIGFEFPFFGEMYSSCIVNANGWMGFGDDNTSWQNTGLPNPDAPAPAIFGFWDDLNPVNTGNSADMAGYVRINASPERLVVWFDNVAHWIGSGSISGTYDFQMVLYPSGAIILNYRSMDGDVHSATIGVQDGLGQNALLVPYDTDLITSDYAFKVFPPAEWVTISALDGIVPPSEAEEITVTVDATGFYDGSYFAPVTFLTNDFAHPVVTMPVIMNVSGAFCQDWAMGDLNNDLALNVLDIVIMVNIIIGELQDPGECALWAADINADGAINVLDVVLVLNIIIDGN